MHIILLKFSDNRQNAAQHLPGHKAWLKRGIEDSVHEQVEFDWARQWTMHVGSVVHRWLQQIAEDGVEAWPVERIAQLTPVLRRMLRRSGVPADRLDDAVERATRALLGTIEDERGRWVLSSGHVDADNELPLTAIVDDGFGHNVIDRTFVADGVRWIIDYKTGEHGGGSLEKFLADEEERYRPQLARYRKAFAGIERRPIHTALYFPLLQVLHLVDGDEP